MTAISVMERKKEKSVYRKLLLSDSCCQTNGTSLITPSSSSSGERKSLGKISAHPHRPAASPMASIHRETVQATVMASCASWGRQSFFCFNSQLGKASEVTLEKCMHQRKKLWKGVGGRQRWSPRVLYVWRLFFSLQNVFPNFHWHRFASYYFCYEWEERWGCTMRKAE